MAQEFLDPTGNEPDSLMIAKINRMFAELYGMKAENDERIESLEDQ